MQQIVVMFLSIVVLYILSRHSMHSLFLFLRKTLYKDRSVYIMIAIFFFPGTLIHELAHYLAAVVLLLEVKSLHLLPEWRGNELKLGKVIYIRRDFLRGILVGVAPVFAGIIFFFIVSFFKLFPVHTTWMNILFIYLIFVVSTMMFSSRQDLIDFVYLVPFLIGTVIVLYIVGINPLPVLQHSDISFLNPFVERINIMIFITIGIHVGVSILLGITHRILDK